MERATAPDGDPATDRDPTSALAPRSSPDRELERLRFALAATGVGVWTWDPVADHLWWSDEVHALFGLAPEAAPRTFAGFVALVDPADRDRMARTVDQALAERSDHTVEYRVRRPDGSSRWLLSCGRVETDEARLPVLVHGIVADVTARRRADDALRLNEQRYRALVFASADVVWTMAGDGSHQIEERVTGAEDRTWVTFTGQVNSDLVEIGWLGAVHPDDRARAADAWRTALAEGREFRAEYRLRRHDGDYRTVVDRGVPQRDGGGRIVQWVGACVDVTERRLAEAERERLLAAVAAERSLLTSVLDQLPAGVIIAEAPSGRTILNNRQAATILGYPAVEAEHLDQYAAYTAVHPDGTRYAAAEYPLVRAIIGAEIVRDEEVRFVRGDGGTGTLSVSAGPIRDAQGAVVAGVAVYFDLTQRKREEERQRFLAAAGASLAAALDYESAIAELTRLIVPALADACVVDVLEPGGVIRPLATAASPETQAVLDELQRHYPAAMDRPRGVARVVATGEPSFHPVIRDADRLGWGIDAEHLRLLRALGTRSNITVALVARGEILGALTLKRIQATEPYGLADLAIAEDLARRAALALDNARLLREARTAVRLRDEFLSSASHDLRNPLTTIQGRVQLLRRWVARGDTAAIGRGLDEIATAGTRLLAMIEELQDVSSLQIGRPLTLHRRATDLVALAREEVEQAQRTTSIHRLRLDADPAILTAAVDPSRLRRVLDNLLGNAIKYSPAGGEIAVRLRQDGPDAGGTAWAFLSVADEGIGIPAAELPRLFEHFFRASNAAGRIAGTGIGLAGARQIVAQHGGTIAVESIEGRGSTFTVRLPFSTAGQAPGDPSRGERSAAASHPTGAPS